MPYKLNSFDFFIFTVMGLLIAALQFLIPIAHGADGDAPVEIQAKTQVDKTETAPGDSQIGIKSDSDGESQLVFDWFLEGGRFRRQKFSSYKMNNGTFKLFVVPAPPP